MLHRDRGKIWDCSVHLSSTSGTPDADDSALRKSAPAEILTL